MDLHDFPTSRSESGWVKLLIETEGASLHSYPYQSSIRNRRAEPVAKNVAKGRACGTFPPNFLMSM